MLHPLIWKNDYQLPIIRHHYKAVTVLFETDLILQTLYHSELLYPLHVVVTGLYFVRKRRAWFAATEADGKITPSPALWAYTLQGWKSATITKADKPHAVFTSWSPKPHYFVLMPGWKHDTLKYYLLLLKILFFLVHSQRGSISTENLLENHRIWGF